MKDEIKFYCLQRDFISHGVFHLYEIESLECGKAWEEIEIREEKPNFQEKEFLLMVKYTGKLEGIVQMP